ncbi:MAG: DUF1007 family protein [Devosia sp.]
MPRIATPPKAPFIATLMLTVASQPAWAHPHLFVDAQAQISFDAEGRATSLHNVWTFDEGYSAFAIEGLDANLDGNVTRSEMQSLADDNVAGLAEYGYYSSAGVRDVNVPFVNGRNAAFDYADGRVTLSFDIDFAVPLALTDILELGISDPQYYVAIQFANREAVELIDAPDGCGVEFEPAHPMPDGVAAQLYSLPADVTKLPSELERALRGVQGAILVNCGSGGPSQKIADATTAVDALDAFVSAGDGPIVLAPEPTQIPADDPTAQWRMPLLVAFVAGGLGIAITLLLRNRQSRSRR